MNRKYIVPAIMISLVTLLLISIGYALHYRSLSDELEAMRLTVKNQKREIDKAHKSDQKIKELKEQVKELESQLQLKIDPIFPNENQGFKRYSGNQNKTTIDDLKEGHPTAYQTIIKYYTTIDNLITDAVQDKLVYFNSLDTSEMSDKEKKAHRKFLEKLAKFDQFSQDNQGKTGNELQELVNQKKKKLYLLTKDLKAQRSFLIFEAGKQVGLSSTDAETFRKQLQKIEDMTSYKSFYRKSR